MRPELSKLREEKVLGFLLRTKLPNTVLNRHLALGYLLVNGWLMYGAVRDFKRDTDEV